MSVTTGRTIRRTLGALAVLATATVVGGLVLWGLLSPRAALLLRRGSTHPTGPVGHLTFVRERARERGEGFVVGHATFVNDSPWWLTDVRGHCVAADPDGTRLGSGPFVVSYEHGDDRVPPDTNRRQAVTIGVNALIAVATVTCAVDQTVIDPAR